MTGDVASRRVQTPPSLISSCFITDSPLPTHSLCNAPPAAAIAGGLSMTAMTPSSLLTPTSKPTVAVALSRAISPPSAPVPSAAPTTANGGCRRRREFALSMAAGLPLLLLPVAAPPASMAESDEEYKRETAEMIGKVRSTITMERGDPNVTTAVADLREASNTWVAKYRREKALLGRSSFRDVYSALNAVSGHYISFGPTAPIPVKRKTRILEEIDTAEKALQRGR